VIGTRDHALSNDMNAATTLLTLSCLLPALALSCANKRIDLDIPNEKLTASDDPDVLGTLHDQVGQVAVDGQRLYWSGSFQSLRSCDKNNCAATVITYDHALATSAGFGLHGDEIFWFQLRADGQPVTSFLQRVACPVQGCGDGFRLLVPDNTPLPAESIAAFGSDAVYITTGDTEISRFALADATTPPHLVARTQARPFAMVTQDDFVYWMEGVRTEASSIRRARGDGDGSVELLVENLPISDESDGVSTPPQGGLAVDANYFYWAEGTLAGAIKRCPLSGCGGTPEVVASPIAAPTALFMNGPSLYWEYNSMDQGYSVASCALANCKPSAALASHLDSDNVLAIDDRYIYSATMAGDFPVDGYWGNRVASIRRFSK
jgi:hypothetical protein